MSRRFLFAAALLVGCVTAAGALVSPHAEDLEQWLVGRSADLLDPIGRTERKQARALTKGGAALAAESDGLSQDAKAAFMAIKRLDRWFWIEPEYAQAADGLLDGLTADATVRANSLDAVGPRFASSKVGAKVDRSATSAAGLLDRAGGESKPVKRARFVWKAFRKLDLAERKARRAVFEGDDRFLLLGGPNNLAARTFVPARQNDADTLSVVPGGDVRTEWETGEVAGEVGNWLLVANWTENTADGQVDQVRLSFFNRIGLNDPVLAWFLDTNPLGFAAFGISIDETPEGTRITFDATELRPTSAAVNTAEGNLVLEGRLLIAID